MIPIDPFPTLIAEILYPQDIPENILPYIEAGINAHNEGSYALAIENYNNAHDLWKDEEGKSELAASLEQFF